MHAATACVIQRHPIFEIGLFGEDWFTENILSKELLTRALTTTVLKSFPKMKLFAYESGDRWKVVKDQI